ncbi:hypothetical protein, partial [Kocuria salsicia]|uniref:hypothetical protein n=1 Tax=Kocuria salsicia TaxID=664639 RepID=UPI001C92FEC4
WKRAWWKMKKWGWEGKLGVWGMRVEARQGWGGWVRRMGMEGREGDGVEKSGEGFCWVGRRCSEW